MDSAKFRKTLNELGKESLVKGNEVIFKSKGRSMWPLLISGDSLFVKKVSPDIIRVGDIVVYENIDRSLDINTAHRVIKKVKGKNGPCFCTKGDNNVAKDDRLVIYDDILGRVVRIKKNGYEINLDSPIGKSISILLLYCSITINILNLSYISFVLKRFRLNIKAILSLILPETDLSYYKNYILLRSNMGVSLEKWQQSLKITESKIQNVGLEKNIADIQSSGGYSEEAAKLIRQGKQVKTINLNNINSDEQYDYIIFARMLNILDPAKQLETLKKLKKCLSQNGRILISWIDLKEKAVNVLKRKIWSAVLGKSYNGPGSDSVTVSKHVIQYKLGITEIGGMAAASGFKLIDIAADNEMCFVELSK